MIRRKLCFVCPNKKIDNESQTFFSKRAVRATLGLSSGEIEQEIMRNVLLNCINGNGFISKTIVDSYRSRLVLNISKLYDRKFDPLTPAENCFSENQAGLFFSFFNDYFTISIPERETLQLQYSFNHFSLFECLETGVVSPDLYATLEMMRFNGWESGKILVLCTDYRVEYPLRCFIVLHLTSTAIQSFLESKGGSMTREQALKAESQILLLSKPSICVSPTISVSRVQSMCDFRQKMWINRMNRDEKDMKPVKKSNFQIRPVKELKCVPLSEPITIPPSLLEIFQRIGEEKK